MHRYATFFNHDETASETGSEGSAIATAFVGLPPVQTLGLNVTNKYDDRGIPKIVVSAVNKKSIMRGMLRKGDVITRLNRQKVPKEENFFVDDDGREGTESSSRRLAVDEFVDMLHDAGTANMRYLKITRSVSSIEQDEECEGEWRKSSDRFASMPAAASTKILHVQVYHKNLGIRLKNNNSTALWGNLPCQKRSRTPLVISHIFESSQLLSTSAGKQIQVGDTITHINGHLLVNVEPAEFFEIVKNVGEEEGRLLTLTIRKR